MVSGDRSNKIAIAFASERCLYSRSTWTDCALCIESCPGKAIYSAADNKPPSLDLSRCMQCGQCLSACPLEAFESSSFSERQLLQRIEPEGTIRLLCFLPQKEYASRDVEVSTYQLGTCLAALTPGVLFELALSRVCELSTDQCRQCSLYPHLHQTLQANVTLASLMLTDWGASANLTETSQLLIPEKPDKSTKPDSASSDFDGFSFMRSSIRSLFHGRRKKAAQRRMLALRAKKRRVPSWRLRLKELWDRRAASQESVCPWPNLVVDDSRCKACGICMQLCPTGSIHQSLQDGLFEYSFTSGTCVNCGLCILSCAGRALSRDYHTLGDPFEAVVCSTRKAEPCSRCGLPVLENFKGDLCFLCLSEPDPQEFISRVKKQMASVDRSRNGIEDKARP